MADHPRWLVHEAMLQRVADALGDDLGPQVAFVGGCATAMLVTDPAVRDRVRFTDDVDVIVHVIGFGQWHALQQTLRSRGFRSDPEDDVLCRMRLPAEGQADLIVDFMPDDERILGFSNPWYADALRTAEPHRLPSGTEVRVVAAPYFLATKLEAYKGRGNDDPLGSRDVEDVLNLVDGRPTLLDEIAQAPIDVQEGIQAALARLLEHRDFDYAVQSAAQNSKERERMIFKRLEALAS